ncbi:MAG TPA: DUF2911 domain-containing protein [Myxococcales bacterium]|nr:DUF2911 domain-containing protein [Myxococcales bacterium]
MRHLVLGIAAVAVLGLAVAANAQQTTQVHPGKAGSPHVRSEWTVDGAKISVTYGRPFLKGRAVGKDVAPYGKEWRTGADEATTLVTDKPLKFGTLEVPAGTYTLYTLPGEKEWQLIVSKKTGQWGIPYPAGEDLGRVPMKVEQGATPVEQLTISIDDTPGGGTLKVSWGTTVASAPFTVG